MACRHPAGTTAPPPPAIRHTPRRRPRWTARARSPSRTVADAHAAPPAAGQATASTASRSPPQPNPVVVPSTPPLLGVLRQPVESAQVIRLVVKGVQESNIDLGKKGFSQGDQEIVGLNVLRGGKKIGEAGQICQFVRVTQASATDLCQVALSLPKGQITAQGLIKSTAAGPGTFFLAITGGTGAYQTAHGQVKITATATNEVPVTLYVIL